MRTTRSTTNHQWFREGKSRSPLAFGDEDDDEVSRCILLCPTECHWEVLSALGVWFALFLSILG